MQSSSWSYSYLLRLPLGISTRHLRDRSAIARTRLPTRGLRYSPSRESQGARMRHHGAGRAGHRRGPPSSEAFRSGRSLCGTIRRVAPEPVTYERSGAAAVLTIDRQERRNAVDGPTAALLADGYERFEADDGARVLILTGAGGVAFCAGADLKAIESFAPRLDLPGGPLGFTRRIASKPTIAAISGWCLAGGLELALWCDLRIAAAGSNLGFPERRWGVPLIDGGTQRLPRIVGL